MSNKKNLKGIVAVALLSCMGLIACDKEVQAKPSNYDDKLIAFTEEDEVYHNLVSIIEDAYRDGSLASAVLDKVLYAYANSVFGTYNRVVTPAAKKDEVTLKEAAASVDSSDKTNADKFLEAHKAYWELDDNGNHVKETEYNGQTTKTNSLYMRVETIYRFVNIDNKDDFIDIKAYGDGIDTGDKAPGKATTYADKYALMKAYKISTGDDPDKDASPETGYKKTKKQDYRQLIIDYCNQNDIDMNTIAQQYKLNAKSSNDEFEKVYFDLTLFKEN